MSGDNRTFESAVDFSETLDYYLARSLHFLPLCALWCVGWLVVFLILCSWRHYHA